MVNLCGICANSEEDADVKGIIATWLADEAGSDRDVIAQLIEDYFYKGKVKSLLALC